MNRTTLEVLSYSWPLSAATFHTVYLPILRDRG